MVAPILGIIACLVLQSHAMAQDPWRGVRPQILTEQQFSDFITIVKEITDKNLEVSPPENATPGQEVAAIADNQAVVEILERNGYTPGEFMPLSINVVMAHVIASSPKSTRDLDAEIAQLNTQKDTMDQQQYQAALTMLDQQMSFLKSAPPENVKIAGKFTDALNAMTSGESAQ